VRSSTATGTKTMRDRMTATCPQHNERDAQDSINLDTVGSSSSPATRHQQRKIDSLQMHKTLSNSTQWGPDSSSPATRHQQRKIDSLQMHKTLSLDTMQSKQQRSTCVSTNAQGFPLDTAQSRQQQKTTPRQPTKGTAYRCTSAMLGMKAPEKELA
jgi:hypothetical protein